MPISLAEINEIQSKVMAHARLSEAAAKGGFTTGLIGSWGPSEANCAAAMAERAIYFDEENKRLRAEIDRIRRLAGEMWGTTGASEALKQIWLDGASERRNVQP